MKKIVICLMFGLFILGLSVQAQEEIKIKNSTAEVSQVQGLYIFVKCKPVKEYEYLGTVKGAFVGSAEFDKLMEGVIKKAKKKFPEANALIFDGMIARTDNTSVSVVIIKD